MSVSEVIFRIQQKIQSQFEQFFQFCKLKAKINYQSTDILFDFNLDSYDLCSSSIQIFGKDVNFLNDKIDWHKDIFSGEKSPLAFSKTLNIRGNSNISAKNIWEINRLQFLPSIAINYQKTKDDKYLKLFVEINQSWIKENPYLIGINWYSNIEVNIRLINWFIAWEVLKVEKIEYPWFNSFVEKDWIPIIYQHCKYSKANPSLFSSANNHLISEYAGLFIAATKWRFKESEEWVKYSKKGLENEITKQHSKGINKEEAAEYIQFITDFFLIAYAVAENSNNSFSKNYKQTLSEIFDYIFEFTDKNTNFPKYGDEDDGKVILLSTDAHYNNFKSLLTSAAIIFNDARFKSKSSGFDLKNQILFGTEGKILFNSIKETSITQANSFYPKEGHFIFRKQDSGKEIYFHFDAAPLGYLSIAAHGHADALSFILHINGFPIFVDSGTYSYHVAKEWRSYFVSTLAHNTVCVDKKNQATQAGDTMWLNHYKSQVLDVVQNENFELVKATHTGYETVIHKRTVQFVRNENLFVITDDIINKDKQNHEIDVMFHLHPDVTVSDIISNKITLYHISRIKILLTIECDDVDIKAIKGAENPIIGWYSPSFLQKEPTTVICINRQAQKSFQIISKIRIDEY